MTVVAYALTTKQKVKDLMGITDTTSDAIIDSLINGITDFIESYCGHRRFLSTEYTEVYDGRKQNKIFLNQYPVTEVTAVKYRSGLVSNPTWVAYDANSYLPYLKEGYIHFYANLPEVPQGLQVEYTAGYLIDFTSEFDTDDHTLPFDITLVATELVAKQMNFRNAQGIESQTTEGQSITYSPKLKDLSSDHKTILNRYKTTRYAI